MTLIDADKFLAYLICSKHIDGLTCGEVKEAIKICKVDVFEDIKAEISSIYCGQYCENPMTADEIKETVLEIIDNHISEK